MNRKKIALCGEFVWPWYQEAMANALNENGHTVSKFGWSNRIFDWDKGEVEPKYKSFWHRIQVAFRAGPLINTINKDFCLFVKEVNPDIVILYHATLITPSAIRSLKYLFPGCTFVQYTPDNPFGRSASKRYWRHFLGNIKEVDYTTPHRSSNFADIKRYGGRLLSDFVLYPYFIPSDEYKIQENKIEAKFKCDVVFAGHFEDDGRIKCLESLLSAGYSVNLFGGGWDRANSCISADSPLHKILPTQPVTGEDYLKALCGASICLCFFSTLNEDSYTTRVFQIPATQSFMLSQDSDDIRRIFEVGKEIDVFTGSHELVERVRFYLNNDVLRNELAAAAYERVVRDRHDINSRAEDWIEAISEYEKS